MWYLKELCSTSCYECDRVATVQLFNSANAPCAKYCRQHGEQECRRMNLELDAERAEKVNADE